MTFKDWIEDIISKGLLCDDYTNRVNSAISKKQIADIGLDANGISYLAQMAYKGYPLPYSTILKEFKNFINGNYVYESIPNDRGYTYKTELYVEYNNNIDVRTTCVALLGCKTKVKLKERTVVELYLDSNCEIELDCPLSSRCRVYMYGEPIVKVLNNEEKVKLIQVDGDAE